MLNIWINDWFKYLSYTSDFWLSYFYTLYDYMYLYLHEYYSLPNLKRINGIGTLHISHYFVIFLSENLLKLSRKLT